jgi:Spy/CpxP family protein refolding chaperone
MNALAWGPGGGHGPGRGPGALLEKHLEELDLEPAKLEAVRAILAQGKAEREQQREEMRSAFQEMHALLEQDAPDESAVMAQAERIGALQTEAHKAMLHTLLAVRAELTPEQRAQLREKMRAERAERPWWRRHRGGEPQGGEDESR